MEHFTETAQGTLAIIAKQVFYNLSPSELIEAALQNGEGVLTDTGALMCDTGKFTGRSPKDKFLVYDDKTKNTVWWGDVNFKFSPEKFDALLNKMLVFLEDKRIYVRQAFAGANSDYRSSLEVINTQAWHNLFCNNMFIRPSLDDLVNFKTDRQHLAFTIICVPEFEADPAVDGTRQANFTIVDMTRRILLIGGTGYAGEIKKGIFTVLNYLLPQENGVLSMHCSANIGQQGDTAIFFGLSGTGKTTLSADPNRGLIGDDEHGWSETNVFNFEGGCYAKVIDLSHEKEPEIFAAIRYGSIVENTRFLDKTRTIDYHNNSVTENTRTAYPIHYIPNAVEPSVGGIPKNIFFLTYDAFGVLPPISKLTVGQAMYHFISGYTSKVAGTEMGVKEPQATFSACFGAAFLPLHPTKYAALLGKKIHQNKVNVWLVNTGMTGGSYGVGNRMKLSNTRSMITATLNGDLNKVAFTKHPIFGMMIPEHCPYVVSDILNPRNTWADKDAYDATAAKLANMFVDNFEKYADFADEEIIKGSPVL